MIPGNWWVLDCNSFTDKQIVKLQETPDEIPEGGTPHTVSLLMHEKLVDAGKPGDRVEVCALPPLVIEHLKPHFFSLICDLQSWNRLLEFTEPWVSGFLLHRELWNHCLRQVFLWWSQLYMMFGKHVIDVESSYFICRPILIVFI